MLPMPPNTTDVKQNTVHETACTLYMEANKYTCQRAVTEGDKWSHRPWQRVHPAQTPQHSQTRSQTRSQTTVERQRHRSLQAMVWGDPTKKAESRESKWHARQQNTAKGGRQRLRCGGKAWGDRKLAPRQDNTLTPLEAQQLRGHSCSI